MRICPKCGFRDSSIWRARPNRPFCDYTKVSNIDFLDKFIDGKYFDGHFVYHVTKSGINVERIEYEIYKEMGWGQQLTEVRGDEPTLYRPWVKKGVNNDV